MSRVLVSILAFGGIACADNPDGASLFKARCASCHTGEANSRAPSAEALRPRSPEAILESLVNGSMRVPGSRLSGAERRAVAEFLTGRKPGGDVTGAATGRCAARPAFTDPLSGPLWNGWGPGVTNTR